MELNKLEDMLSEIVQKERLDEARALKVCFVMWCINLSLFFQSMDLVHFSSCSFLLFADGACR